MNWIAVSEKLPSADVYVLYWTKYDGGSVSMGFVNRWGEWETIITGDDAVRVTHWMPVPEGPEVEDNEDEEEEE